MSKGCSGSMKCREEKGQETLDADLGIAPIRKKKEYKKKVLKMEESSYMAPNEGRDAQ